MTQISGKIYQMKNAAGTENRFPRTVMEAVLGLSSYLQDQFSSLADIYMPIEGIYEALTGQEFVFRESPNTIKAKSLTIDRIKGKTLAWNQYATGISVSTAGPVVISNRAEDGFTATAPAGSQNKTVQKSMFSIVGHKYYLSFEYTSNLAFHVQDMNDGEIPMAATSNFVRWSKAGFKKQSIYSVLYWYLYATTTEVWTLVVRNYMCVDLTLMFGAGNEPTTEEFEALYPLSYYPNVSKLISNDASEIETVGFNQFDESTWVVGKYRDTAGVETDIAGRRRSDVYFKCFPSTQYYFGYSVQNEPWAVVVCWYDANKNFISGTSAANSIKTSPANAAFFKISGTDNITGNTCINLSDPAKNGTYEPYRKSTLPLNLDDFWVKDGQGNQVHITGGLKSAGSVCDEIVGNKYIKRVGSVDLGDLGWLSNASNIMYTTVPGIIYRVSGLVALLSSKYAIEPNASNTTAGLNNTPDIIRQVGGNIAVYDSAYTDAAAFKTAMNGVMLYYELTTPIEYELVEPLVPTVKAGTTEARISPNADGLSAPFRADITYSAQENNDAATSQYAATAGRLLNAQTIWGQTFDGSSPVSGALTGVTTIDASGAITAGSFVKTGGTASQFLKANGTVDSTAYYHPGNSNLDTVDWAVRNLTLAGTITGATSIDSLLYFDTTNSRVGIGTSSPAHKLDVSGTFRATGNSLIGGTLGVTGATTLSSTLAVTGNTTLSGSLNIGNPSSRKNLSVYGDSFLYGMTYVGKDEASAPCFVLDADSQAGLKIRPDIAAANHYMHLSPGGVLTVTDGIVCNGNISLTGDHFIDFNSGTGLPLSRLYFNTDNNETFFESPLPIRFESGVISDSYITAGAAAASSDARLKDNVSAISTDKALSILSSLRGAEWDWNEKSGLYGQHGSGLVAQEVQKVMPWAVLELNDKLSLNYNSLWGIVIPVIQSLKKRIEELESRLA